MNLHKLNIPFLLIWLGTVILLVTFSFLVVNHAIAVVWIIIPLVLLVLVAFDTFQNKHAIPKNYPLTGRLRYLLESFRPELRIVTFD